MTVYIGTSDVWNAGVAEGIANLLLGATSGLAILALLFSSRFPAFLRTGMMPLLLVLWTLSTVFVLVTSTITTVFVATRQAKVEAFLPNGTRMPDNLVQTFSKQLGMSPEYSTFGYRESPFLPMSPTLLFQKSWCSARGRKGCLTGCNVSPKPDPSYEPPFPSPSSPSYAHMIMIADFHVLFPPSTSTNTVKFMSIAPWFAFVFALLSTILTVVAWRKSAATSAESEVAERKAAAVERGDGDAGSAEAINDEKR